MQTKVDECVAKVSVNMDQNTWDYSKNGEDWPIKFPACGSKQQSPVNLLTPISKYGKLYSVFDATTDMLKFEYWNQKDTLIKFDEDDKNIKIKISNEGLYSGFESKIGQDVLSAPIKWTASEI